MVDEAAYRVAYDEAVRALRAQADAFAGIRQRASTVLATSMVVTAFFGGQAVTRGATPRTTGWLAVVAFLAAGILSVLVLFPSDPAFTADPADVLPLAEADAPLHTVAVALAERHAGNRGQIARLQWIFRLGAVALLVEVLLWIVFLALS
jgi:hypothetical protein